MPPRAIALLAAGAVCAAVHAVCAPTAQADRPLSDITCAHGERATYDRGARRFGDNTIVLGCTRLVGGGLVQVDAGSQDGDSAPTCLWLTFGPPPSDGLFACGRRFGSEPRVLLILRDRSISPFLVVGVAPATAERVVLKYSSVGGTPERARARLIRAGDRLAERVGAPEAFGAFVAELGPAVDVCEGVEPRASGSARVRSRGRPATPTKHPLGRPDGWLAGFAPSYGVGYGPGDAPNVCDQPPGPEPRDVERPMVGFRAALNLVLGHLAKLVRSMVSAIQPLTG